MLSSVVIVSPALPGTNNGNARTAERWRDLLAPHLPVRVAATWPDARHHEDTVLLALHARRSAAAIRAWSEVHAGRGLAVVLTGTDLYQDLQTDAAARQSLEWAQRLVVLQECGADALAPHLQAKTRVIFQSAPSSSPRTKPVGALQAVMVGHLRAVKSPATLFEAARLLRDDGDITITHIGDAAGDPALGEQARATEAACPDYTWTGALPHAATLDHIAGAHVLVHTSAMEGGAHVILEAVRCGTPVLASRVPGNVGMLGADYAGYFPHGDAGALAQLLRACRDSLQDPAGGVLGRLVAQCRSRAPLFEPEAERAALIHLVHELHTTP